MRERSMVPRMASAMLALLGLLDATYLTLTQYIGDLSLHCPVGGGCETVQQSAWSTFPAGGGVPVALIGVVGYTTLLLLSLVGLHRTHIGPVSVSAALLLCASVGVAASAYLTWLQVAVIGALCFWCVCSALVQCGIFAAAVADRTLGRAARPAHA